MIARPQHTDSAVQRYHHISKVIFLGRKPGASRALEYLSNRGVQTALVVAPREENYRPTLKETAESHGIALTHEDADLYEMIQNKDQAVADVDLVISYLHWKKILQPLFTLPKYGCINFHPAPLPDYKSRAGYNTAILEKKAEFGVSVHFIDSETFDSGPIIQVRRFPIDSDMENALSLERKTQEKLLDLFKETMEMFLNGRRIETTQNNGGLYLTSKQLEDLKEIDVEKDSTEQIDRKIRAFFFPPYTGAKVKIRGREYTLVNDSVMKYVAGILNGEKNRQG